MTNLGCLYYFALYCLVSGCRKCYCSYVVSSKWPSRYKSLLWRNRMLKTNLFNPNAMKNHKKFMLDSMHKDKTIFPICKPCKIVIFFHFSCKNISDLFRRLPSAIRRMFLGGRGDEPPGE